MQRGSSGTEVSRLQTTINQGINFYKANPAVFQLVYPSKTLPSLLSVDGNFGQNTENALFFFTGKRSITVLELNALITQMNATAHA